LTGEATTPGAKLAAMNRYDSHRAHFGYARRISPVGPVVLLTNRRPAEVAGRWTDGGPVPRRDRVSILEHVEA
jgi:hypothetical protein